MKGIVFLLTGVLVFTVLMQLAPMMAYAQETPEIFQQTLRTKDGCEVTHMYATKMYVPIMVKMFHDPTPNWQVTSVSLTNNTNSVVTSDGNDKFAFLISTNSTDQFNFRTVASYTDGLEHPVFVEFWSQNQQIAIEQFQTDKGYFCRDFQVDTSVAPPVPDYNRMIQEAQAGAFQGLISAVLEEHGSVDNLTIVQLVSTGISIFVLIIFLIFHRSSDSTSKKISNKVKHAIETLQTNLSEINMISQHIILSEKQIADKEKRRDENFHKIMTSFNNYAKNWQDQFVIAFRSMMLDTGMIKQEKLEEFEKLTMMDPVKVEEQKTVEDTVDVTTIEQEIPKTEPVVEHEKKSRFGFLHREKKKEKPVRTEEEWKQFFIEKKLTKEQILKLYNNMTSYIQKNYRSDMSAYNKYNALFHLYQELDQ